MKNDKRSILLSVINAFISLLLWVVIWALFAKALDLTVIFPGPIAILKTLFTLIYTLEFWITVLLSIGRILLGLLLGIVFGIALAAINHAIPFSTKFITIGMTVIKSTPVASIVLILWVIIGSARLPTLIGILMVMPIIWQNLSDGFSAVDKQLVEVGRVFKFSAVKSFRVITLPTLVRYFIPAVLTSVGLAWKSGIAAEIIAYTKNSIGKNIADAKAYFEGDVMLAWTLVVIVLSLALEGTIKFLLRRFAQTHAKAQ